MAFHRTYQVNTHLRQVGYVYCRARLRQNTTWLHRTHGAEITQSSSFPMTQAPQKAILGPTSVAVGCEADPKSIPKGSKTMPETGSANFPEWAQEAPHVFFPTMQIPRFLYSGQHAPGAW